VDEELRKNMETQQIYNLLVAWRQCLRKSRSYRKAWEVLNQMIMSRAHPQW